MAHLVGTKGPYPDKAGEFCGNHSPGSLPIRSFFETAEEAAPRQREYLARMRFGRPSNCDAGTTEEMVARGYVGLYLKEDCELLSWETPTETDELTEDYVSKA